jgi:hypothetical protein
MTKTLYVTGKMYEANTVSITDAELVDTVAKGLRPIDEHTKHCFR